MDISGYGDSGFGILDFGKMDFGILDFGKMDVSGKCPVREKVEQGLRQELSSFCSSKDSDGRAFDIQIPEFSLEVILTGSSKVTA